MKIRLKKKYVIILLVLAGISLFALVVGGSYAFFTHQVTSKDYVVYTGNLQVDYTKTGSLINLTNTYPKTNTDGLQEAGYSFNITNNGNIDARYQIRLELDTNNTIPIEYIKLAYVKEKENNVTTNNSYIEPVLLSNLNNTLTFVTNQQLEASKMDSYTLKMWIDYNAPNDIQGKIFKATIVIDSLQDVEDGYVMANTRPIITLNKYSDGNTDIHILVNEQFTDPGILSVKDDKDLLTEEDVNITYDYTSDGTNLSQVSGIDTTTPGVYYINYEVTDSDRQEGKIVRTVTVNETASIPTITLNGNSSITINEKKVFTDPGVTVENNNKVAVIGEVKTSVPGTYIVRYIVVDRNNNINSVVRTVIVAPYVCSIEPNTVYTFEFDPDGDGKGQEQTFTVPCDGEYKIEAWGAQGGLAHAANNTAQSTIEGGYGGYSIGNISAIEDTNIYINVGGKPSDTCASSGNADCNGGYNGGGAGHRSCSTSGCTAWYSTNSSAGGGATHIALYSGLLSQLSTHAIDGGILLVSSGGGGSSGYHTSSDDSYYHYGYGGHGGGIIGVNGYSNFDRASLGTVGNGATQSIGGTGKNQGTFGLGGLNGGGGGYYGGGGADRLGAGGGSGYIASSNLISTADVRKAMYCYGCQEALNTETDSEIFTVSTTGTSEYVDTTNCPNGYSEDPIAKCAKVGNGYARITYLGN